MPHQPAALLVHRLYSTASMENNSTVRKPTQSSSSSSSSNLHVVDKHGLESFAPFAYCFAIGFAVGLGRTQMLGRLGLDVLNTIGSSVFRHYVGQVAGKIGERIAA